MVLALAESKVEVRAGLQTDQSAGSAVWRQSTQDRDPGMMLEAWQRQQR